jgi:hypothetical protein
MENTNQIISSALSPREADRVFRHISNTAINNAREIVPGFIVDEELKPVFRALCLYFGGDPRFEEENFGKLNKGLCLSGNVGCGKTVLMKAFKKMWQKHIIVINTHDLVDKYMTDGVEVLYHYLGHAEPYCNEPRYLYCFDDLGSENTSAKYMGNELNVMERVIISRYERGVSYFIQTHFTTNLDGNQIEQKYGTRVRSRLREMVNFIPVPGDDRRK